ncbi:MULTISPECIES: carbohydrate ABC transporter permease [Streptomyces]|uniref:Sugar ABC transporter permease n=1 Tax=Streptomyces thermoviolaceus subsp. thermoviolaceus TaxID=66860 RepID=A0ABX0YP89_STRTL|nr:MULTISPECIES: sugar ABC transporter permease [Streptomyces]MCM3264337.1 sugar ABC transporter permease [Streptomyces thermoviolaceus]NJP13863.1 sugar ABC transporter permease [Streptomyces thermoviolaceus subsp. thermoviolaceus]RSS08353.1 sugar ABC transporter permease [Streptomyces sp. WAC00469]WTD49482.1 sugar ABC transporter permease [Streptomyces thermoviolaceus]GGV61414.1 ABC transporter permease [Streptomyces thermoviolaceus subsp. apingens]
MTVAVESATARPPGERGRRPGPLQRLRRSWEKHWYAYAMIAPVVVVLGVLVGYPLVRGFYLTLTDANSLNSARTIGVNHIDATYSFVGLDNYRDILFGPTAYDRFWSHFVWTVVWTALCVLLHYAIGLGLALLLNRKMRGRTVYRLLLILPWAVPTFVTVFSWRVLLADSGALNQLLGHLHLPQPAWLEDTFWQRFAAVMVNTWCGVPFMMVSLLGGLQSIDSSLYEAAEMDGANAWQRFRHVTLPGLRSVSSTVVLLGVIWTFNQFNIIFLLFGQTSAPDAQILVTWAYRLGFGQQPRDYAQSAAYGVLLLSILTVFTSVYFRWLKRNDQLAV